MADETDLCLHPVVASARFEAVTIVPVPSDDIGQVGMFCMQAGNRSYYLLMPFVPFTCREPCNG